MNNNSRGILSVTEYRKPANKLLYALFMVACSLVALVMIYPLLWVVLSALKSPAEIFQSPPTIFPAQAAWENFAQAWEAYQMPRMLFNTAAIFLGFMVSRIAVVTLAAYSLSKLALPFRQGFYLLFLATLILPTFAIIVPSYLVIIQLGLYDNWLALILPAGASSMQLLLMKGFIDEIPSELIEAGRIDGAGAFRILWNIVLPNAKPIIAVLCIFSFLQVWNDFFFPHLVLSTQDKWTMPIMVWYRSFSIGGNPPMNVQLAGMCIALVPPLVLFAFFQKYITEGVSMSGIKG